MSELRVFGDWAVGAGSAGVGSSAAPSFRPDCRGLVSPAVPRASFSASCSVASPERTSVWNPGRAASSASHSRCSHTTFPPTAPLERVIR